MSVKSDVSRNVIGGDMSKFKIGDKVRVKYIPGVTDYGRGATFHQYLDLQGEKEIQWISPSGFTFKLKDDPDDFWFCEESLELLNTSGNMQRTLLGLETETDHLEKEAAQIWKKIWSCEMKSRNSKSWRNDV